MKSCVNDTLKRTYVDTLKSLLFPPQRHATVSLLLNPFGNCHNQAQVLSFFQLPPVSKSTFCALFGLFVYIFGLWTCWFCLICCVWFLVIVELWTNFSTLFSSVQRTLLQKSWVRRSFANLNCADLLCLAIRSFLLAPLPKKHTCSAFF